MGPGNNNSFPAEKRVAVVTGGNRGSGLEICKQLASNGVAVVLTARDEERGAEAAATLRRLGLSEVLFHQLDVAEPSSAACLADFVRHKFGKLDILVNNAGILGVTFDFGNLDLHKAARSANEMLEWLMQHTVETTENAEECLRINYHGNKNAIQALLPLLQSSTDGRIVAVFFVFGQLLVNNAGILGVTFDFGNLDLDKAARSANETLEWLMQHTVETTENAEECLRINYHGNKNAIQALLPLLQSSPDGRIFFSGEQLKDEPNDADTLSEERIDELAELFIRDFKDGELESWGWPARADAFVAYKTSKALQHAYTRILARKHASSPLRVNCVHPGYVKTDMTLGTGELTVEEGAAGPVALALSPPEGTTGMFFICIEPVSFV